MIDRVDFGLQRLSSKNLRIFVTMTQQDFGSCTTISNSTLQWCNNIIGGGKGSEIVAVQIFIMLEESNSQSRCPVKGSSRDDSITSLGSFNGMWQTASGL